MDGCRLLHLSDPHFGAHDQNKCDAILSFAQSWAPDIVVVTGDIVDSPVARNGAIDTANTFLNLLRSVCSKLYCVPGNHDALFGSWFLDKVWRKLQPHKSFVERVTIRGTDVCLIGVDTTHTRYPLLNSTGAFEPDQEERLEKKIETLRKNPGFNADRAIWIMLAHHHPIPTVTANAEAMLYLRNAGQLMRFANKHRVRLILHGHKHDPHFTKIAFGSDQDDDVIAVLSAGSCSKADGDRETSGCGHFYAITIDPGRAEAQSYWYHRSIGRFVWLNQFGTARAASPEPQLVSVDQRFEITREGHMRAVEIREYRRTHNRTTPLAFNIGVDDDDAGCNLAALGLRVSLEGLTATFHVIRDEPTLKWIRVDLPAGAEGEPVSIRIDYLWPGGFRKFLVNERDSGEFSIRSKGVAWCRLRLSTDDPGRHLDPITVYHRERDNITGAKAEGQSCGFTIQRPHANSRISWAATIRTVVP